MQYLPPRSANFAFQNSYNLGRVGQLNYPCPSSPGATRSNDLFDCCVVPSEWWKVPLDDVGPSKAPNAGSIIYIEGQGEW